MAKAPRPGRVKTRLNQSLSSPALIALYRCLLEDTVALTSSLRGVEVAVMCPEEDKEELTEMFGDSVPIVAQKGEGLAAGLTSVFRIFTERGGRQVIAFNSDSPHLASSVLINAFQILASHDVVIGPTNDGGYYLVGAKDAYPALFEGDGMGTRSALERLMERVKSLQLTAGFTEVFYDIDVEGDLLQLGGELARDPQRAPRTAAWFAEWKTVVEELQHRTGER